ncbi:hypothetical protein BZG82_09925 [Salinivibrio sp. PR5]|nr:hypothetical protein BZG82_09925 [Salinivibrio sp. PR5]
MRLHCDNVLVLMLCQRHVDLPFPPSRLAGRFFILKSQSQPKLFLYPLGSWYYSPPGDETRQQTN